MIASVVEIKSLANADDVRVEDSMSVPKIPAAREQRDTLKFVRSSGFRCGGIGDFGVRAPGVVAERCRPARVEQIEFPVAASHDARIPQAPADLLKNRRARDDLRNQF